MKLSSNNGTVSLLVAGFVLPLLFLAFSLGLDLTAYQAARTGAQSILDNAAIHAARFLPFREQASFAAVEFASRAGLDPQFVHASAPADSDRIIIRYDKGMQMAFPALLGVDVVLPVAAMSAARITPKDSILVLDLSAALAPAPGGGSPWGNSNEWDAQLFNGQGFGGAATSILATQQCFNPVLNSFKRAAIDLYDYLSSFRFNQVGVTVAPGVGGLGVGDSVRSVSIGGFQNGPEAQFIDGGAPIRNAVCLAISEREPQSSSNYNNFALYEVNADIGSLSAPPPGRPTTLVDPNGWIMPFDNLQFVSTREAIWSQVARSGAFLHPDTSNLILETVNALGAGIVAGRGTLGAFASKEAIVLFSDLPWQNGARFGQAGFNISPIIANIQALKTLSEANKISTRLRLVFFPHQGVCNSSAACDGFRSDVRQFEGTVESLSTITEPTYFKVQVLLADSADELQAVTASAISVSDKNAMLSR